MKKIRSKMNRTGQIAIWVIVAAVFVAIILVVFLMLDKKPEITISDTMDVQPIIDQCAKDAVKSAVELMLPQGGFIEPTNYKAYNRTNISYLCQNEGYFNPCIMQHSVLLIEMEKEIHDYANPRIEQCFQSMKSEFEKRNMNVELGQQNVNVSLAKGKIRVLIERKLIVTKNEETSSFEIFKSEINSPLYELGKLAIEIANQEAQYCNFEYLGYMAMYPGIKISKTLTADSTKIYTLKDIKSEKKMNIAIKGCVIPAGI